MCRRWGSADGWAVEVVCLTATPNCHDGQWIRVTCHGYYVADVRDPAEVEQWVRLAELEPEALRAHRALALSWRGRYHVDGQPGSVHDTVRCPRPSGWASRAGSHQHGSQPTRTRPGPHRSLIGISWLVGGSCGDTP